MSIKAFDFYIMDKEKLPQFLKWCKKHIYETTYYHFLKTEELKELMNNYITNHLETWNKITKTMQSTSYTDNEEFELTAAVSIWIWNKYAVVKLFGIELHWWENKKIPRYVSEFSYWDNTDKEESMLGREWGRRRRFFNHSIDDLERIEYRPLDFLGNGRVMAALHLRSFGIKKMNKEENKK